MITGKKINQLLNIGASHALYRADGKWYHHLENFPGALFDENGYIFFNGINEYNKSPYLKHTKDIHIKSGISNLPNYIRFNRAQKKLIDELLAPTVITSARAKLTKKGIFAFSQSKSREVVKVFRKEQRFDSKEIKQLHRLTSEALYSDLVFRFGVANVNCDCNTGNGTFIDIVHHENEKFHFYEIKTYDDIRRNIREALGQLLEYAYWNFNAAVGDLIIVSPQPADKAVKNYMASLRIKFNIPIFYQQFDSDKNRLAKRF